MSIIFEPIVLSTLRGQIAERLREAVLSGSLKAGERIVERSLAAQFGASLTAIREAVISLEAEGLIVKKPNTSTYVTKLTTRDVESIFEVRRLLEPYAVGQATELATEEQLDELRKGYLAMVDAARQGNVQLYVARDYAWHAAIWAIPQNDYMQVALRRLTLPLFGFSSIRFSAHPAFDLLNDATSHSAVLECMAKRNAEEAVNASRSAIAFWYAEIREFFVRSEKPAKLAKKKTKSKGNDGRNE